MAGTEPHHAFDAAPRMGPAIHKVAQLDQRGPVRACPSVPVAEEAGRRQHQLQRVQLAVNVGDNVGERRGGTPQCLWFTGFADQFGAQKICTQANEI
jgi:hypothetical protein